MNSFSLYYNHLKGTNNHPHGEQNIVFPWCNNSPLDQRGEQNEYPPSKTLAL